MSMWTLARKGIDVHIGDSSSLAMSRYSRYCKSFTKLPDCFAEPDRYFEEVCNAVKKYDSCVLMPSHEDVRIFSERKKELPENVHIAVPDLSMWEIAEDQFSSVDFIRGSKCPMPETTKISSVSELDKMVDALTYPIVIKTRKGNSAKGVRIARSPQELRKQYSELVNNYNLTPETLPVLQEYLPGNKYGCISVFNNGKAVSVVPFHIRRSKGSDNFGTSTFRVTVDDIQIIESATYALEKLNWHGVVDMDLVKDEKGKSLLIDINGRLGGATALTIFCGADIPYLWYLIALGEQISTVSEPMVNVSSRWIVGDVLCCLSSIRRGKLLDALKILVPVRNCYHDDFNIRDPIPFIFECMDYAVKFVKAGFSANPVTEGQIR